MSKPKLTLEMVAMALVELRRACAASSDLWPTTGYNRVDVHPHNDALDDVLRAALAEQPQPEPQGEWRVEELEAQGKQPHGICVEPPYQRRLREERDDLRKRLESAEVELGISEARVAELEAEAKQEEADFIKKADSGVVSEPPYQRRLRTDGRRRAWRRSRR